MGGWDESWETGATVKVETPGGVKETSLVVHMYFDTSPYSLSGSINIDLKDLFGLYDEAARERSYASNNDKLMRMMAAGGEGDDDHPDLVTLAYKSVDTMDQDPDVLAEVWPGYPDDPMSPRDMDNDEAATIVGVNSMAEEWSGRTIKWHELKALVAKHDQDLVDKYFADDPAPSEANQLPDNEDDIIGAPPKKITPDYVLAVYQKAKELRSNKLLNYARQLSSQVQDSQVDELVRKLLEE
jgi:hypothetical protein